MYIYLERQYLVEYYLDRQDLVVYIYLEKRYLVEYYQDRHYLVVYIPGETVSGCINTWRDGIWLQVYLERRFCLHITGKTVTGCINT